MIIRLYNFHYVVKYYDIPAVGGYYVMNAHKIRMHSPAIYLAWSEVE